MRTCPSEGDNSWKRLLIPHMPRGERSDPLKEWLMSYQLVGEVRAHQGDDG